MGTCGGAPSSFLCVAGRRGGDRCRRDYPSAQASRDFSQRKSCALVPHFDIVPEVRRPEFSGFAGINCSAKTAVRRRAGAPRRLTGKPVKGLGEHSSLAGHDAPG